LPTESIFFKDLPPSKRFAGHENSCISAGSVSGKQSGATLGYSEDWHEIIDSLQRENPKEVWKRTMRFFGSASTVAALANMNVVVINLDFDNKWEVFRPDHPQRRYSQQCILFAQRPMESMAPPSTGESQRMPSSTVIIESYGW
jgi:hypothetical protein